VNFTAISFLVADFEDFLNWFCYTSYWVLVLNPGVEGFRPMFRSARYGAVACSLLGPVLLSACGATPHTDHATALANPAPPKAARSFTIDTPVDRIAANPNGKAVLDRDMPGLMASKEYALFDDMSLSQIAMMSGGRISKDKLSLVQTDLVQVSDLSP
jgi:hypothetical protein